MSEFSQQDYLFMKQAIALAKKGLYTTSPNPRVGCVIVKNGVVVGQGFHEKAGEGHAEVHALKEAGEAAKGATAYVTLEPCSYFGRTPPCANALINAQVSHVISAMVDPNPKVSGRGLGLLNDAGITTQSGLLEDEAKTLNIGFITLMTQKKPYVRCKLAASLDGKTAMANGESQWITSAQARQDVQRLRAQSCAIISGADSIIVDQARMNVRWQELGNVKSEYAEDKLRQPVRVIIDSKNRLTPDLPLFSIESPVIIMRSAIENIHTWPHFVKQVCVPFAEKNSKSSTQLDLSAVLMHLSEIGLNDVLIESGARLAGAFIDQQLVDELILFQAPKLLGAEGKSLVNLPSVTNLVDAKSLAIKSVEPIGPDIRITATFTH